MKCFQTGRELKPYIKKLQFRQRIYKTKIKYKQELLFAGSETYLQLPGTLLQKGNTSLFYNDLIGTLTNRNGQPLKLS